MSTYATERAAWLARRRRSPHILMPRRARYCRRCGVRLRGAGPYCYTHRVRGVARGAA
jgi:hypothetical protein